MDVPATTTETSSAAVAADTSSSSCSPCDNVRRSCLLFAKSKDCLVAIDTGTALPRLAQQILDEQQQAGATMIEWDQEDWHYRGCPDEWQPYDSVRKERVASYILALDAINFCFWPEPGYEYEDLATTLTRAAQADHPQQQEQLVRMQQQHPGGTKDSDVLSLVSPDFALSATKLQNMSVDAMRDLFARFHSKGGRIPPDMEKRCALWNEVGRVLNEKFDGSATALIERAHGSAPALVQLLVDHFPGFRDHHHSPNCSDQQQQHHEDCLYFYKRAQICVGDWNAALDLQLRDLDRLTTFADYRVPQLLRHHQVLRYAPELAAAVDAQRELAAGGAEELSIRAATVAAVEYLVEELKRQQQQQHSAEHEPSEQRRSAAAAVDGRRHRLVPLASWRAAECFGTAAAPPSRAYHLLLVYCQW